MLLQALHAFLSFLVSFQLSFHFGYNQKEDNNEQRIHEAGFFSVLADEATDSANDE